MSIYHIIDLDDVLERWAANKLGSDYVIDKLDASQVDVTQTSVSYQSTQDWWSNVTVTEQFFDNDLPQATTWNYSETLPFDSKVTWTITKAFKSARYLPARLDLKFPVAQEGKEPLQVQFNAAQLEQVQKSDGLQSTWRLHKDVTVAPYASACACARIRACRLVDVAFATDLCISGSLRVVGARKGKKWKKTEVIASIVDALSEKEGLGFAVIENKDATDGSTPARQATFRFEGTCTGKVGIEAYVDVSEITSLV